MGVCGQVDGWMLTLEQTTWRCRHRGSAVVRTVSVKYVVSLYSSVALMLTFGYYRICGKCMYSCTQFFIDIDGPLSPLPGGKT